VCLCAALCGGPDVLLLDEPEAALDTAALDDLAIELAALAQAGHAIVIASHAPLAALPPRGTLVCSGGRVELRRPS
jgi:energy-coupling factor transport system ATP-binding protein